MISRSRNRFMRNGSTDARSTGPPRLKSTTAVWELMSLCSDRLGEDRPSGMGGQILVKMHAEIADEQAPAARHFERRFGDDQEPIVCGAAGRGQRRELGREVRAEIDAEAALEGPR